MSLFTNKTDYFNLALEAYVSNDIKAAEKYIKKALVKSPDSLDSLLLFGNIFYIKQDYIHAEQIYQKILLNAPKNQAAIINCADIYILQNQYTKAEDYINKIVSSVKADFLRGKLAYAKGEYNLAQQILLQYTNKNTTDFWGYNLLSQAAQKNGDFELALTSALVAVEKSNGMDSQHLNLSYAIYEIALEKGGDFVMPTLEKWYQEYSQNSIAIHAKNSFAPKSDFKRAEPQYIKTVFDNFADSFEATLNDLCYVVPQKIAAEIKARFSALPHKKIRILDAGCGTGLCAPEVDSIFKKYQIDGVDLSSNMLEFAKEKKLYSELRIADIETDFFKHKNTYNIILAADVFTYFGDLKNIFSGACFALQKKGVFVFSVSKNFASSETWSQHISGRFLHGENYIKNLLSDNGFSDIKFSSCVLRKEGEKDVVGWVVSAIKKAS